MGCCAGKLQFHKETKRQDKNEYLAAARAVDDNGVASSSFGEAKFKSLVASHPQCASALSEWCRSRVARIYPAGHGRGSTGRRPSK